MRRADRSPRRHDELANAGDLLVRVEKEPLPVEADDVDHQRVGTELIVRVEALGGVDQREGQSRDHEDRHAPHRDFQPTVELPVRRVGQLRTLAAAIAPHDQRRQHQHGQDRQEDDERGDEEMLALPVGDLAERRQEALAGEGGSGGEHRSGGNATEGEAGDGPPSPCGRGVPAGGYARAARPGRRRWPSCGAAGGAAAVALAHRIPRPKRTRRGQSFPGFRPKPGRPHRSASACMQNRITNCRTQVVVGTRTAAFVARAAQCDFGAAASRSPPPWPQRLRGGPWRCAGGSPAWRPWRRLRAARSAAHGGRRRRTALSPRPPMMRERQRAAIEKRPDAVRGPLSPDRGGHGPARPPTHLRKVTA